MVFFASIAVIDTTAEIFLEKQVPLIISINLLVHTEKKPKPKPNQLPEVTKFECVLGGIQKSKQTY